VPSFVGTATLICVLSSFGLMFGGPQRLDLTPQFDYICKLLLYGICSEGNEDMNVHRILGISALICCLGALPATGHDCCHHSHHCNDCCDGNYDCCYAAQTNRNSSAAAPYFRATDLQTIEGKITEIIYLPGATPDSGTVEARLQSLPASHHLWRHVSIVWAP
jgi:hypothetical protein